MKPFNIEISSISKGPDELKYQLPIRAKVLKEIPGKDRPDYFLAELDNSIVWVDDKKGSGTEVTQIIICTKYKKQYIDDSMKDLVIAIAYVLDNSVATEPALDFKKCKYIALGEASAKGKWSIFG